MAKTATPENTATDERKHPETETPALATGPETAAPSKTAANEPPAATQLFDLSALPEKQPDAPAAPAAPADPKPRGLGRPSKYESEEERMAAKRERDRARRSPERAETSRTNLKAALGSVSHATVNQQPTLPAGTHLPVHVPQPMPPTFDASQFVNGFMLLTVMDAIMPFTVIKLVAMVNPKAQQIKPARLKMSPDEKKDMRELADNVSKTVFTGMSPMTAFVVCMGALYGGKLMVELDKPQQLSASL